MIRRFATSTAARHQRTPLIKFLGPRAALAGWGHAHASSSQQPSASSSSTSSSTSKASKDTVYYEDEAELPTRFKRKPLKQAEMDAIQILNQCKWPNGPQMPSLPFKHARCPALSKLFASSPFHVAKSQKVYAKIKTKNSAPQRSLRNSKQFERHSAASPSGATSPIVSSLQRSLESRCNGFARFEEGTIAFDRLPPDLMEHVKNHKTYPVHKIWLIDSGYCILYEDDSVAFARLNPDLSTYLAQFQSPSCVDKLRFLAVGPKGQYIAQTTSGKIEVKQYAGASINSEVLEVIDQHKGTEDCLLKTVALGFDDASQYYIKFVDEATAWHLDDSGMDEMILPEGDLPQDDRIVEQHKPSSTEKVVMIAPLDLIFTKSSISRRFACGRDVETTMRQLKKGDLDVDDLPLVRIFYDEEGLPWCMDNKRLFAFVQAGLKRIPAKVVNMPGDWHSAPQGIELKELPTLPTQ
ncbi:hypothetical protein SmJEL517_g02103 [Synchytrium microbalum]|uniref:Uncharacterized protein n=1 Tax=Synchytrium microbalum TaxID=1806994 RepID=A0A507C252_9FUNG|nr:uncharacterized protein SmJEL517_g02103 [Synchytrium microbalum]TPX35590.1 hypothetical protein SmJEL517_g02103 [Synchytrium microbalum]